MEGLQEGTMSFEELMAQGNTLDIETGGEGTEEVETVSAEEAVETVEENVVEEGTSGEESATVEQEEEEEQQEQPEGTSETNPVINTTLTGLTKKYLENGKWDDVVLEVEGEEIQLSELDHIDEDTFLQIQEAQENLREEARKDQFIPKEGLNDVSLKLIELQKNGGNITEAIQIYNDYVNPLEGLDLTNERIQEQLVRKSLSTKSDDPDIVEMSIEKYKKDGTLGQKADQVVEMTNSAFSTFLEKKNKEAAENKKKEAETHKTYLKTLEEEYKTVDLKPELKKEILQLADKNEKGEYRALDVVREQLQDPKLAQELLFFLNNREAFKKSIGVKGKAEANISTLKKIKLIKDKERKQTGGSSKTEGGSTDFDFIEVDKL